MNICFYASFRRVCGGKNAAFDLPAGASLQDLLDAAVQRYPGLGPLLWDEAGQILPHVRVLVNGHDSQHLPAGLATPLSAADKIDIFPPLTGGSVAIIAGF